MGSSDALLVNVSHSRNLEGPHREKFPAVNVPDCRPLASLRSPESGHQRPGDICVGKGGSRRLSAVAVSPGAIYITKLYYKFGR